MTMRESFLLVAERYCVAANISRGHLSKQMLGGGTKLDRIAAGGDMRTATYERAMQWMSDTWPPAVSGWPDEVDRPPPRAKGE